MLRLLFIFLFLNFLLPRDAEAQFMDSLQAAVKEKPRFTFKFDTRNSFISNQRAEIFGFKLGVDFNKKIRIGGGLHTLNTALYKDKNLLSSEGIDTTVSMGLHFGYFAYYIEYVFYKTNRWEFSVPLQMGWGDSRYEYVFNGKKFVQDKKTIVVYESAVSGQYKFFKWLGVGADVGLRLMLRNNRAIPESFNSPIYAFKLLIWYGEIYKALFPNTKLAKYL